MNIEELTKSQIFLLTILTSFVTSMATGIVAVALMDQGPTTITQSVSRIIQETVEKTPDPKSKSAVAAAVAVPLQAPPAPAPKEKTLSEFIAAAAPSVVRIFSTDETPVFLALGVVTSGKGSVITNSAALTSDKIVITFAAGTSIGGKVASRDAKEGVAHLTAASSSPQFAAAVLGKLPEVGDAVYALSGKTALRISSGLVVALTPEADASAPTIIETNITGTGLPPGTPLIDAQGNFIGMLMPSADGSGGAEFMPISAPAAQGVPEGKAGQTGGTSA